MRADPPEYLWDAPAIMRLAWLDVNDPEMAAVIRQLRDDAAIYEGWLQNGGKVNA